MVQLNFSARTIEPNVALEPLPTALYPVLISASSEKPTKAGTGAYIELEMTIQAMPGVDPKHVGRKVYDRLNIRNPSATAVEIAFRTLSAICYVTGVLDLQDTQQLHGRPFIASVAKVARNDQPDTMTNEVRGYKDINGNDPNSAGTVAVPASQPGWAQQPQPAAAPVAAQPQPVAAAPAAAQPWAAQAPAPTTAEQPAPVAAAPVPVAAAPAATPPWATAQ